MTNLMSQFETTVMVDAFRRYIFSGPMGVVSSDCASADYALSYHPAFLTIMGRRDSDGAWEIVHQSEHMTVEDALMMAERMGAHVDFIGPSARRIQKIDGFPI